MSITIKVPATELWDPVKEQFVTIKEQTLLMEHSLLSIDKWESRWKKSYLSSENKTPAEVIDYLKCMTITKNVDSYVYYGIPATEIKRINDYISDPMTATTFNDRNEKRGRKEVITSEIIYWQMTQLNIPMEWEKRHLNKLLTLIRVAAIKSQAPQKMSKADIARQNKALNAARRKRTGSKG